VTSRPRDTRVRNTGATCSKSTARSTGCTAPDAITWRSAGPAGAALQAALVTSFFRSLDDQYAYKAQCPECQTRLRPILITPTYRKDYRNPHLARIWYDAERALQRANRVIFVGYSLPDDDVEVIYLLKRGLGTLSPRRCLRSRSR